MIILLFLINSLFFVFVALWILAQYERRPLFWSKAQPLLLAGLLTTALWELRDVYDREPEGILPVICSVTILLVMAVVDGQTGYVYDFFGYGAWIVCMILARGVWQSLFVWEKSVLVLYVLFLVLLRICHGIGGGDIPVYLALLCFYLRFGGNPAVEVVFLFLLSQSLCAVGFLINRKKRIPLVPYIWMAHVMTLALWE